MKAKDRALEIGPLDKPILDRELCDVSYVDVLDDKGLREKYESNEFVVIDNICSVDIVLGEDRLSDRVKAKSVDFIVASHVFEHLPNPIGFLEDCAAILTPEGVVSLALPDKRYSFDYARRETCFPDWIAAYAEDVRWPSAPQIADHMAHVRRVKPEQLWQGYYGPFQLYHSQEELLRVLSDKLCNRALLDCHLWVFSDAGCLSLVDQANRFLDSPFRDIALIETEYGEMEFFLHLTKR